MIACPICGAKTRVFETRGASATNVRRRRGCTARGCSGKVTTLEVAVPNGRAVALGRKIVAMIARGAL